MTWTTWIVRLALLAVLAGCEVPSPPLQLFFSKDCPSVDCQELPLTCDAWVSVRIIDPLAPQTPYLSECKPVRRISTQDNLCALGGVDFDRRELPLRTLEVQVAVVPASMVMRDEEGNALCPSNIQYDAVSGFPVAGPSAPALGGRSYYRPGDSEIAVTLGCTYLELIHNDTCVGTATVRVAATVDDFDTRISVGTAEAGRLSLSVGEPRSSGTEYVLEPGDVTDLVRTMQTPPAWATNAGLFDPFVCLAVREEAPQTTTTLTCKTASITQDEIDFTNKPGVRLTKQSLDQVLDAVGLTEFPLEGLTIGIVLDVNGNPRSGITVVPTPTDMVTPTIRYLSSDRTTVMGTSTSGGQRGAVWVSTDAPFGTVFSASTTSPPQTVSALGGRIEGKVTIVVLRFPDPIIGG